MAHELTQTDGLVLTGRPAWHGLGIVVENAPTALEALKIARLDWTVQMMPVSALSMSGGMELADDYRAATRADTSELFAIVGKGYQPVQNADRRAGKPARQVSAIVRQEIWTMPVEYADVITLFPTGTLPMIGSGLFRRAKGRGADGYGKRISTRWLATLAGEKKPRKVFAVCVSNVASHYVIKGGKALYIRDSSFPDLG